MPDINGLFFYYSNEIFVVYYHFEFLVGAGHVTRLFEGNAKRMRLESYWIGI